MIQIKNTNRFPGVVYRLRRGGFTLLELVVVICIASVIATVFVDRLRYYQERAEKASMDLVLARTKMGLQIRMAELIMTRRQKQVVELETENPMRWLEEPPSNYAGEYSSAAVPGNWYYASREHALVYLPMNGNYLEFGASKSRELRFRVEVPMQADGATGSQTPAGVAVKPTREYKWF
jgi:prepilin-type N-terminal cleavage/methylation domain-containing protein